MTNLPPHFEETDPATLHALVCANLPKAIVGVEIPVQQWVGKCKASQKSSGT